MDLRHREDPGNVDGPRNADALSESSASESIAQMADGYVRSASAVLRQKMCSLLAFILTFQFELVNEDRHGAAVIVGRNGNRVAAIYIGQLCALTQLWSRLRSHVRGDVEPRDAAVLRV